LKEIHPEPPPIHGENVAPVLHELRYMGGLATRRGTGIENEVTWLRIEERGNELGSFIFDIEKTLLKSGEGCHKLSFF
jgi:hypothetical protein